MHTAFSLWGSDGKWKRIEGIELQNLGVVCHGDVYDDLEIGSLNEEAGIALHEVSIAGEQDLLPAGSCEARESSHFLFNIEGGSEDCGRVTGC